MGTLDNERDNMTDTIEGIDPWKVNAQLLAALEAIIAESRRIVRSDDDKRLYNIDKLATAALAAAQKAG